MNNLEQNNEHLSPLGYAAEGYARVFNLKVFPLQPRGKVPITKHGCKDATTDITTIKEWWRKWPNANIGLATGLDSGIGVLDFDAKPNVNEIISNFEKTFNLSIPITPMVFTGGNGYHYYFKINKVMSNRTGILQGVDWRAEGGYVVLPPSIHENGQQYQWIECANLRWFQPVPLPKDIENIVIKPKSTTYKFNPTYEIPSGSRNEYLTFLIGKLFGHKIDVHLARQLTIAFNEKYCTPPLETNEVNQIIESIASRELKKYQNKGQI